MPIYMPLITLRIGLFQKRYSRLLRGQDEIIGPNNRSSSSPITEGACQRVVSSANARAVRRMISRSGKKSWVSIKYSPEYQFSGIQAALPQRMDHD